MLLYYFVQISFS